MNDLVAWLRAQIDADEAAAKAAGGGYGWNYALSDGEFLMDLRGDAGGGLIAEAIQPRFIAHIVRHDPARVLADVAAKRAIVDAVESWPHVVNRDAWHWCPMAPETRAEFPDDDIEDRCTCSRDRRALAILGPLAYAYHVAGAEGWREEWRP